MRVMLKAQLEVEAANLAISDGSINGVFEKVFAVCRPEATYFLTERGQRTVYAIFDMTSLDQIPVLAEPLFQGLGASVDFMPVMIKRLTVTGSTMRPRSVEEKAHIRDALLREVWPAYADGRLKTHVFGIYPIEKVAEAHRIMEGREHIGKLILQVRG